MNGNLDNNTESNLYNNTYNYEIYNNIAKKTFQNMK